MTQAANSKSSAGIFEPCTVESVPWEDFSHDERFACRTRTLDQLGGGTHVGVRLTGEAYRKPATMEYWEGETGALSSTPTERHWRD